MGEQGVCPENFNTIDGSTAGGGQSLVFTNQYVPTGQQMCEIKTAQLFVQDHKELFVWGLVDEISSGNSGQ